jgi:uncharacterized protein
MIRASSPLVTALLDRATYPHPVERVEMMETHISWVFLAGDRAYKVKKPAALGFLDFTTLERRRFFCEEEVRLNRRLTHDVYLGVSELTESDGHLRFGGPGSVREVAVVMRRLPHDRMLDHLVRERRAKPRLLEDLGGIVARFHAATATGGEIDELGGIETVRANWDENFSQTADLPPDVLPDDWRRALSTWVDRFLGDNEDRLARRVEAGHSRDCHGDLQAQHVCCTEPIQIFDCIEFNHRFRYGDTASEVAFLGMDLDRLGRPDLGVRFLNAYLVESGDYEAVPLLDFYRAYRAYVRGKVLGFQISDRSDAAAKARDRFALAVGYTRRATARRLVITTGVMGSGKSTLARHLAARLGAIVVRTDAERKRLAGVPLTARDTAAYGEGRYTAEMGRRTYETVLEIADEVLRAGWPVVVDGAFSSTEERALAQSLAARHAVPFTTVWCEAPDDVIAERLRRRGETRREISEGRLDLLRRHRAEYASPEPDATVVRVDTTPPADEVVENVLRRLSTERAR